MPQSTINSHVRHLRTGLMLLGYVHVIMFRGIILCFAQRYIKSAGMEISLIPTEQQFSLPALSFLEHSV